MTDAPKPAPCPCGSEPTMFRVWGGKKAFIVECEKCRTSHRKTSPTKEAAIAAWNRVAGREKPDA